MQSWSLICKSRLELLLVSHLNHGVSTIMCLGESYETWNPIMNHWGQRERVRVKFNLDSEKYQVFDLGKRNNIHARLTFLDMEGIGIQTCIY